MSKKREMNKEQKDESKKSSWKDILFNVFLIGFMIAFFIIYMLKDSYNWAILIVFGFFLLLYLIFTIICLVCYAYVLYKIAKGQFTDIFAVEVRTIWGKMLGFFVLTAVLIGVPVLFGYNLFF